MKVLVSCMKDEGPFILEWLAHHLVVGFDRIIIYTNDCSDGSDLMLEKLAQAGFVDHVPHDVPQNASPQPSAYRLLKQSGKLNGADWAMVLDADELLNIHLGAGRLDDLIGAIDPKAQIMMLNWRNFGASKRDRWQSERNTVQFPLANKVGDVGNDGVKSLVRDPNTFTVLANHSPRKYIGNTPLVCQTASGQLFEPPAGNYDKLFLSLKSLPPDKVSHEWAQINHYATRSMDCFILRAERGRGWHPGSDIPRHSLEYFEARNASHVKENSIARYDEEVLEMMSKLRAAPGVAGAEKAMQEIYNARLEALHTLD